MVTGEQSCLLFVFNNASYLWKKQQVVPGMNETFYDAFSKQSCIHCFCHHQGHPEQKQSIDRKSIRSTTFMSLQHKDVCLKDLCKMDLVSVFYLCGMSFGTSISRDFIWRILMLPSIPLAATTSRANSNIVLDSSQAYTSAAPAFLAHILNRENQKIRTIIENSGTILAT